MIFITIKNKIKAIWGAIWKKIRPKHPWITTIIVVFIIVMLSSAKDGSFSLDRRPKNKYKGDVEVFESSRDLDKDGINDQADILANALAYVATRPIYRSKYYDTGYPDDRYGTCVDVVNIALRDAGYDMMYLIAADVEMSPESYPGIITPDRNIDFRRVDNLKNFFERYGIPLTTDINVIQNWQGGDIVIFEDHIGIVSDRRNEKGIPYIIHHNGFFQVKYEEDILEKRDDLVGHYRISE